MTTEERKNLIDGLTYLANISAKAAVDKQSHSICEAVYTDIKKILEAIEVATIEDSKTPLIEE